MTARSEILEAARALQDRGLEPFAPADILQELRRSGSTYPESTLRTHIVSIMCTNAPSNHAVRYPDLERVGRGQYRLAESAGGPPVSRGDSPGRESDRAGRRDPEYQLGLLRTVADMDGSAAWPLSNADDADETQWQVEDLIRRGYAKWAARSDGVEIQLTRAGKRAAQYGFPEGPAGRRELLQPHELELLHQLMWDAAEDVADEERRKHTGGIKWMLEDHFFVETRDGAGPQGRPRKDALARLESIGAIEQIGGGSAKRTGNCWITDPGMVSYPW